MRISMQHFERRPQSHAAMRGFADLVFEDRTDMMRTVIQVTLACCVGLLLGTIGQSYIHII